MQEARAASALNHPNIVTLHDIANDNGIDYLVMEYVPGKSLDKLITPKGLPLAEAIGYATQIASALAAAHAAGIVHRDIKPANVIVTQESQVKVLDFGLAKLTEPDTAAETLTEAGTVMGTVAYMSPEQASARPLDHRTDIFSLGVMLYEMLAGKRPFARKTQAETMSAIINDPAPPLEGLPVQMEEILDKVLAKDPKERYQSAGDLAVDLRRAQRSAPVVAVAAPSRGRPWAWMAAAALMLIAGAAAATWFATRPGATWTNPLEGAHVHALDGFRRLRIGRRAVTRREPRHLPFRSGWSLRCIHRTGGRREFRQPHQGALPGIISRADPERWIFRAMEARCGCGSPPPIPPAAR